MADRVKAPDEQGLSSDQLADEQAQDLPDREAMSILSMGGISGPLPIPVPSEPEITLPTPPSPPNIPIPTDISPEDAATLASVAGDLREINTDIQDLNTDINDIKADVRPLTDPQALIDEALA